MAAIHRGAAAEIQAEFDEACAGRTEKEISVSPLVNYGTGGLPTADGVVISLSPGAGNADKLMADMRCHRAWMMMQRAPTMDTCSLDLAGLTLEATGDKEGISVTLHVKDRALVPELQRRAARDLEQGAELRRVR